MELKVSPILLTTLPMLFSAVLTAVPTASFTVSMPVLMPSFAVSVTSATI